MECLADFVADMPLDGLLGVLLTVTDFGNLCSTSDLQT